MSASIREISATMSKSKANAAEATGRIDAADQQSQKLNEAAQAMGGIVELIGNITGQINLLALNATIESARAGEAGRGFAVVASEVKNLANQAKHATDTISKEIEQLNGVAGDVAGSLTAIKAAIAGVNEFIASTAAAVEEQSIVTQDMSNNMQRASAELSCGRASRGHGHRRPSSYCVTSPGHGTGMGYRSGKSSLANGPAHAPLSAKDCPRHRRRARHRACDRQTLSRRGLAGGAARHRGRIAARRGRRHRRSRQYAGTALRRLRCQGGG